MTMVVVRQTGGTYLFKLPGNYPLEPGDHVIVETMHGEQPGTIISPAFDVDPEKVCPLWGTTPERMKPVVAVMRRFNLLQDEETIPR